MFFKNDVDLLKDIDEVISIITIAMILAWADFKRQLLQLAYSFFSGCATKNVFSVYNCQTNVCYFPPNASLFLKMSKSIV